MNPEIITVHDVQAAIEHASILPYANRIIQGMGGDYFFVDATEITQEDVESFEGRGWDIKKTTLESGGYFDFVLIAYKILPVPLKVAHFIISVMKGVSGLLQIDFDGPAEETGHLAVYLLPGTEIFGHKVEKVTEIPAEMRPVVVEKL